MIKKNDTTALYPSMSQNADDRVMIYFLWLGSQRLGGLGEAMKRNIAFTNKQLESPVKFGASSWSFGRPLEATCSNIFSEFGVRQNRILLV